MPAAAFESCGEGRVKGTRGGARGARGVRNRRVVPPPTPEPPARDTRPPPRSRAPSGTARRAQAPCVLWQGHGGPGARGRLLRTPDPRDPPIPAGTLRLPRDLPRPAGTPETPRRLPRDPRDPPRAPRPPRPAEPLPDAETAPPRDPRDPPRPAAEAYPPSALLARGPWVEAAA